MPARRRAFRAVSAVVALALGVAMVGRPRSMPVGREHAPRPVSGHQAHHGRPHDGSPPRSHLPDQCCALCFAGCAGSAMPAAARATADIASLPVVVASALAAPKLPHRSVLRYRQPLPIGPPASRAV